LFSAELFSHSNRIRPAMSSNKQWIDATNVCLSAMVARIRMPVDTLASLKNGDIIEIDTDLGAEPLVRLTVQGRTVAIATVTERDEVLRATISQCGPELDREPEKWDFRKSETKGVRNS
jgi:flagellar motor switch/type III secretory pathway protein FliN